MRKKIRKRGIGKNRGKRGWDITSSTFEARTATMMDEIGRLRRDTHCQALSMFNN